MKIKSITNCGAQTCSDNKGTEAPGRIKYQSGFERFSESSIPSLQSNLRSRNPAISMQESTPITKTACKMIKSYQSEELTRHGCTQLLLAHSTVQHFISIAIQ